MKLSISTRAARAAMFVAVTVRLFLGLAVELPTTHNGAWISALIGALLAAPWVVCVRYGRSSWLVLIALTALDAASVLASITRSTGYLALDRASPWVLTLPVAAAALWSVWRNGDAIGYAASIGARLALLLLVIVGLLQARAFRPAWLAPVLGSGWPSILEGGIRAAGWIAVSSSTLAVADGDDSPLSRLIPLAGGALAAALLLLLSGMITPTRLGGGWLNRLDDLLCNGRAPLYTQLPMIVVWFAGLLHLLAAQCFACAALVQRTANLNGKWIGAAVVAAILLVSRLPALNEAALWIARWGFLAAAIPVAATALLGGGDRKCASGD